MFAFLVDGGWTEWITLNNTCIQINNSNIWGTLKYRNCSQPQPKWGGKDCNSSIGFIENSYDLCPPGKYRKNLKSESVSIVIYHQSYFKSCDAKKLSFNVNGKSLMKKLQALLLKNLQDLTSLGLLVT
jgi:hypothetical protein